MDKYLTRGVQEEIALELMEIIWQAIDEIPVTKDYLQIVRIKNGRKGIRVQLSQDIPVYQVTIETNIQYERDYKLFIVEENGYQVAMLAEEY